MAALSINNAQPLFNQGGADLLALFALRNINAGDTLDISALGIQPAFQIVKLAILISPTGNAAGVATISANTIVTIPAGLVKASGYLLISGC